jgi:hypothetical protein
MALSRMLSARIVSDRNDILPLGTRHHPVLVGCRPTGQRSKLSEHEIYLGSEFLPLILRSLPHGIPVAAVECKSINDEGNAERDNEEENGAHWVAVSSGCDGQRDSQGKAGLSH